MLLTAAAGLAISNVGLGGHAAASRLIRVPPVVYVPAHLPAGRVPLVVVLHGSGGNPQSMETTTGFDRLAAAHRFIVAYLGSGSPHDNWILPSETPNIGLEIDRLERTEPVDPRRVYVTGFSAGGYESYRTGCFLSAKVAAIAPVGVSMNAKLYAACKISRPVSALIVIGSADTEHYGGHSRLPSAPAAAARWRKLDRCARAAPRTSLAPGPTTQQLWSGCAGSSAVGLDVIAGGGHVWPSTQLGSAGPDARFEAAAAIWAFFATVRAGSPRKS